MPYNVRFPCELSGKSAKVANGLAARMQESSEKLEFETASVLRDRIRALAHIQSHQGINVRSVDDADVIAVDQQAGQTCIQVFFFRGGSNYGNRAHFPTHHRENSVSEVLGPFVGQFYEGRNAPKSVLLSHDIEHAKLVEEALNIQEGLAETLELDFPPNRIEVYDNSHTSGSQAVGAMIVAGLGGLTKNAYRKFNIRIGAKPGSGAEIKPGDDYGMMRQVLMRRFARLQKENPDRTDKQWPDLVVVDGGAGQLSVAGEVFADLGVRDVALAAVAKGPERAAGRERIYLPGRAPIMLPPSDPVLYFLQRLRDEAHRFAIGAHRTRRSRDLRRSELDEILGVGPKRKRAHLHRFGSVRAVADAGLQDLQEVGGINHKVAQLIYNHFHSND